MKSKGKKLAYYTSAETALKVINSQSIWMRSASLMNDFQEIEYGKSLVSEEWRSNKESWANIFDDVDAGLINALKVRWEQMDASFPSNTFLLSLSEYDDDDRGRLSMWRGYGGDVAGVAFVFRPELLGAISKLELYPVHYGQHDFGKAVIALMRTILMCQERLTQIDTTLTAYLISKCLQDLVLSTKHPGFAEEHEWRVVVDPDMAFLSSSAVQIVSIGGLPQKVFSLGPNQERPLILPEQATTNLLHKIVIEPCKHPKELADALQARLIEVNPLAADVEVVVSDIPWRQRD